MPGSTLQDVFPHFMSADICDIEITHRVSRYAGRRSTRADSTEIARIRDESEQRAINGIADYDAAHFTRLHLRRSVASGHDFAVDTAYL